jgi:hypothetical protein
MSFMKPEITKRVDAYTVFFTVNWSPLRKAEKFDIVTKVPSMAGLFELYYMDEKKKLNLFYVGRVWIGGLRSRIRRLTDSTLEIDEKRRKVLETKDCYYRFSLSESYNDLTDVFFFFSNTYFPHTSIAEHSGRFDMIYVKEVSPQKIVTI